MSEIRDPLFGFGGVVCVVATIPASLPETSWKQLPERIRNMKMSNRQVCVCPKCLKMVREHQQPERS